MINLPPEIIQIIFLKLCSTRTIFPLRNNPRLLVTRICSQWRAIALGMPSLWSNLRIPINFPPPYDHILTWISRSAPSALSVGFYGPIHRSTFPVEMFDLIVPEMQRCVYLKLCVNDPTLKRLLTLPPGSLRSLRSISTRPIGAGDVRILRTIPRVTAFQHCPQLRHVSFEFVGPALDPAVFELPWDQLTHLSIHSCSLREYEMLNVLRQCMVLQECSISTFPSHEIDTQKIAALALRPIVLSSLHTLRLKPGEPRGGSIHFVHALRLPRLRSLCLIMTSWVPCALLPLFRPLLSETVHYFDVYKWITDDLPAALALMPNLKTLVFRDNSMEVLRPLGDGAIVPRLAALRVGGVMPVNLFNMLEARMAAARADSDIAAFTNVSVVGMSAEEIDAARLAEVRASGVQLVFGK